MFKELIFLFFNYNLILNLNKANKIYYDKIKSK